MGFIKTAYLPQKKVTYVIGGALVKQYEQELSQLGVKVAYITENPIFALRNSPLTGHADLFVNYVGEGRFFLDGSQILLYSQYKRYRPKERFIDDFVYPKYPRDCLLNCLIIDKLMICNKSATHAKLLNYAAENGIRIINVKQGYCKCSVLPVSTNAFITDDEGISKALKSKRLDVLYVEKGSVALKGYDYGFIGGCAGKISKRKMAFCGNIKLHKNYNDIKAFLDNYRIEAISLSNGELTDVGSLIPIIEK